MQAVYQGWGNGEQVNMQNRKKLIQSMIRIYSIALKVNGIQFFMINILTVIIGIIPGINLYIIEMLLDCMYSILVEKNITNTPFVVGGAALLIGILNALVNFLITKYTTKISYQVERKLEADLITAISDVGYENYENQSFYDELDASKKGIQRVSNLILLLPTLCAQIVAGISILIYISRVHILFPLLFIVGNIPLMLLDAKFGRKRWNLEREQTLERRKTEYYEKIITTDEYGKEVRLFSLDNFFYDKWEKLYDKLFSEKLQLAKKKMYAGILGQLNTPVTIFMILFFLVKKVRVGMMKVVDINVYINAAQSFATVMFQLFGISTNAYNDILHINDYYDFIDKLISKEYKEKKDKTVYKDMGEACLLHLEDISFKYREGENYALKHINMQIFKGEVLAVVGCNGSGKTTLTRLILGLFSPEVGNVLVNNRFLNDILSDSAYIMQDFVNYNFTVNENIALGKVEDINNGKRIKDVAIRMGCDEYIERLPNGYKTILGKGFDDNGCDLSGGEWQKLAIARGEFSDSQLLILDEPTSALDPKAEAALYKQISMMAKYRTLVMISHRLGSTKIADRIIVLDNGEIVEVGKHDELLQNDGLYCKMYKKQAQWYD